LRKFSNIIKFRFFLGFLYLQECKSYLQERELPLVVAISEDATRTITKVEYDARSNQLIGFVAPYDHQGLPKQLNFPAKSAQQIVHHFQHCRKACNCIVIMAQPIVPGNFFKF
jgi:hypothetical protein